jgi:uncharacterized RDD family membrane protein YckC
MQKPTKVVGRRVVAYIIDSLIIAAIAAVSWYLLTKNVSPGKCIGGGVEINGKCRGFTADQSSHRTIWFLVIALASIGFLVVMQGLTGRTPGKAIVGIRVIKGDGQAPGILRVIARELLWIIDGLPGANLVGFITAMVSKNNQRVGDMVAGTYVVDRNFTGALEGPQPGGAGLGAPPPSGEPVGAGAPQQGVAPPQ